MIECICINCGEKFLVKKSVVEKGRKYCTRKCYNEFYRGKIHHFYGRKLLGEKAPNWKGGLTKLNCQYCGKEYEVPNAWIKRKNSGKFCSKECSNKYKSENYVGKKSYNWQGGVSFIPYPIGWKKKLKESIRDRDKVCQLCGKDSKENGEALSVHHIDYNKDNLDSKNLVCLCRKCHSKIQINKQDWQEYFNKLLIFKELEEELCLTIFGQEWLPIGRQHQLLL